tara:strand:- start:761 stop:1642 length:882 start_codon:yes stop_codon:yes gene_type:complete
MLFSLAECKLQNGIYPEQDRIIVIGDLHADFTKTKQIFIDLDLIDESENWIANPPNTHIVQLGDQIDGSRGFIDEEASGELELIDFMERINTKARKVGGAVHSLIGNHEIMNLIEDFRYASKKDIEEQKMYNSRKEVFKPNGMVFGPLAGERHAILKIGKFIFSHAGILPKLISDNESGMNFIIKINTMMKYILKGELDFNTLEMYSYFLSSNSILFNRKIGDLRLTQIEIDEALEKLDATHQFVGHTIQENINSQYNDKLWLVDVGMSECFENDNIQVLEIINNEKFNIVNL